VERRFVIFLALTLLIWTGFIALRLTLAPPPPPVAKKPGDENPGAKAVNPPVAKDEEKDKRDQPPADAAAPKAAAAPANPRQLITLGSLDPASPYRMLVTLDSSGAAVQRAELNSPRYKSVEDYSGYLGHLELSDGGAGGAVVGLVGPGTPAAQAQGGVKPGLLVGDVIRQIDGKPIAGATDLQNYLSAKTRPDQKITLSVERSGVAQPITFTVQLARRPLEVVRPESHSYKTANGGFVSLPEDPLSLLVTLDNVGGRLLKSDEREMAGLPSLHRSNWKVEAQGPDFAEFSFTLDEEALAKIGKTGSLKLIKRYALAKADHEGADAYHLDLTIAIHNQGSESLPIAYRLDGPTGLPLEGWWYSTKLSPEMWTGAGARDVAYNQAGIGHKLLGCPKIVSRTKELEKEKKPPLIDLLTGDQPAPLIYAGIDSQFFAAAVLPQPVATDQPIKFRTAAAFAVQDVDPIPKTRLRTADVSFRLATVPATVRPGAALTHQYRVFLGPKDRNLLAGYGLDQLIEYGWTIFKLPAQFLLLILNLLHAVVRNYGIAIILLTVIVRSCMIPVSLKQARSAAKMQELAPEIQRIKDKYPDDPMKQHAAVQELYKKHNFNMFAGCLPVFIQLPIFIGLYRCLSVNIDLRDAALLPGIDWASNLAGPDKLFYWKDWVFSMIGDEADGWLGPFFNVLPLITVSLFLVQQKMFTPPATDEQTAMQQQMMTYMTVIMGVMFYKVPAGLCLYFITSSLWGICERKLLKTNKPDGGKDGGGGVPAVAGSKPASPNGSGKSSWPKKQKQRR
jgi:YidC/Oxa1 family membrane protein insertase